MATDGRGPSNYRKFWWPCLLTHISLGVLILVCPRERVNNDNLMIIHWFIKRQNVIFHSTVTQMQSIYLHERVYIRASVKQQGKKYVIFNIIVEDYLEDGTLKYHRSKKKLYVKFICEKIYIYINSEPPNVNGLGESKIIYKLISEMRPRNWKAMVILNFGFCFSTMTLSCFILRS